LLALLLVSGCGHQLQAPTSPVLKESDQRTALITKATRGSEAQRSFYPLEIGNRWLYQGWSSTTITPQEGEPITKRTCWTREAVLARFEILAGMTCVREERAARDESQEVHTVRWLREDGTGLYEVGGPPPPRDSVTYPYPYQTRLLAFPVHRGAKWVIDKARRITAEVEAREVVETPAGRFPAWRMRVRYGGHLPDEQAFVWYGGAGYLGGRVHLQFEKPDGRGGRIVTTEDQEEWLKSATLAGK
jgi:hypothetical protein